MKTFTKLIATAAILASTSTFALAQADVGIDAGVDAGVDTGVDAGADTGVDAGVGADVDANAGNNGVGLGVGGDANANANADANADANAAAAGDVNYGQIISSLQTSNVAAADIEAIGADAQIDIITLSEIKGNAAENASALDEAVSAQSASLADLTAAIEANADVSAALEAEGYTTDQIVAVTSSGEGSLTIVVDDAM
ncbi:hypothetical protein [Pelagibacterium sp. H642]|uniref:hypothetical protein n=1 Tax=Pelagibacterium sp. H642 TaxID=1881069 RepID=UPI002816317B|nr:hypothetical protein [Pelagibacterium sp. H642]WMT92637.1 hypothetical protein NO934_20040 [Pelagibacterium sp. H642]